MAHPTQDESARKADVPDAPPDAENDALIDAHKTFKIMLMSAVLFCLAAAFIILRTRMG